jgi:hypothetical protein
LPTLPRSVAAVTARQKAPPSPAQLSEFDRISADYDPGLALDEVAQRIDNNFNAAGARLVVITIVSRVKSSLGGSAASFGTPA